MHRHSSNFLSSIENKSPILVSKTGNNKLCHVLLVWKTWIVNIWLLQNKLDTNHTKLYNQLPTLSWSGFNTLESRSHIIIWILCFSVESTCLNRSVTYIKDYEYNLLYFFIFSCYIVNWLILTFHIFLRWLAFFCLPPWAYSLCRGFI